MPDFTPDQVQTLLDAGAITDKQAAAFLKDNETKADNEAPPATRFGSMNATPVGPGKTWGGQMGTIEPNMGPTDQGPPQDRNGQYKDQEPMPKRDEMWNQPAPKHRFNDLSNPNLLASNDMSMPDDLTSHGPPEENSSQVHVEVPTGKEEDKGQPIKVDVPKDVTPSVTGVFGAPSDNSVGRFSGNPHAGETVIQQPPRPAVPNRPNVPDTREVQTGTRMMHNQHTGNDVEVPVYGPANPAATAPAAPAAAPIPPQGMNPGGQNSTQVPAVDQSKVFGPPSNLADPTTIGLPKTQPTDLSPERKFYGEQGRLIDENTQALQKQREQQEHINQLQYVADTAASRMADQNASATLKAQEENKAAWQAAMKKAEDQSADIARQARELGQRKIDPNRYFNNLDSAGRIGAGLAMAFGAFAATMRGTPNFGLQTVQAAINNDIAAQKTDLEAAYKSLGIQQDEAHTTLQRAQIDAAYRDKQTIQQWEMVKNKAQAMSAMIQSPIEKQKADMALNGIDNQIRQSQLSFAKNLYDYEVLERRAAAGTGSSAKEKEIQKYITDKIPDAMKDLNMDYKTAKDYVSRLAIQRYGLEVSGPPLPDANFAGKKEPGDKETAVKIPLLDSSGSPKYDAKGNLIYTAGKAINPEAAKAVQGGALTANIKIIELTDKLMKMREGHGGLNKSGGNMFDKNLSEEVSEADSIRGDLVNAVRESEGLNRFSEGENTHIFSNQIPENPLQMNYGGAVGVDPIYAKLKLMNETAKKRAVDLTNGGMVAPVFTKSDKDIANETGGVK